MAAPARLVAVTALGNARGSLPFAAALGLALARRSAAAVICSVGDGQRPRPTLLASAEARQLEGELRSTGAAARGSLCWVAADERSGEWMDALRSCLSSSAAIVVLHATPTRWREVMDGGAAVAAAAFSADPRRDRTLATLTSMELRRACVPHAVLLRAPNVVASRRALAGLDPGGALSTRTTRIASRLRRVLVSESGQALPALAGLALAAVIAALMVSVLGVAAIGGARLQRAADLAAVSAARSLLDDHPRLFKPPDRRAGRSPRRLTEDEYRTRAVAQAHRAVHANGISDARIAVRFPGVGYAPTRVRVEVAARSPQATGSARRFQATATAEAFPGPLAATAGGEMAEGGGYAGPLAYRDGEGMRPDVAVAFDRLAFAAGKVGHALFVTSGFRSDAEQAALFAANPDPRWVARPGTSLHRCATELDLGPPSAYGWLAANAARFGFLKRYSWEAWHFGFTDGPAPCAAALPRSGVAASDGRGIGAADLLPAYVPTRYRAAISEAAQRSNVPASLLAAQLLAESGFNPFAVSPAGAHGIAQFMPATAAAYGLEDPFNPGAAIAAQGRLMADLLRQFNGRTDLALAAYNAGPAPVAACGCVPQYPETTAYVMRILGLLGGAGVAPPPELAVRLVR